MAALAYPVAVGVWEAILWTGAALGIIGTTAVVADKLSKADSAAKTNLQTATASTTCQTCKPNPCAALAGGVPGSQYRGGAHGLTKLPYGDGKESHHIPANAVSPLPDDVGPAIQMDPADHKLTESRGSGADAKAYRATQKVLIDKGQFMTAQAMDFADIHAKFGSKYDAAIAQAIAYTACLKKTNVIK